MFRIVIEKMLRLVVAHANGSLPKKYRVLFIPVPFSKMRKMNGTCII